MAREVVPWGCAHASIETTVNEIDRRSPRHADLRAPSDIGTWIELRRQGVLESEIASRHGVTQQAVSKAVLQYGRKLPAAEAEALRGAQLSLIGAMREMALQAVEQA